MAILVRCPNCYRWAKPTDKVCGSGKKKGCGANLQSLKKAKKVNYYVDYLMPDGKPKREKAGKTLEEARAAEGKRLGQRYENPKILMKVTDDRMTFNELKDWYLGLSSVQRLRSYIDYTSKLSVFCRELGDRAVGSLKLVDLEDYQSKKLDEGLKATSIDVTMTVVKGMVLKAIDNDMISIECRKPFDRRKKITKPGDRARKRRIEIDEFVALKEHLPVHAQQCVTLSLYTGMRVTEPLKLTWDMVDWKTMFITLPGEITKTGTERKIPITLQLEKILRAILRDLRCPHQVIHYKGRAVTQFFHMMLKEAFKNAGIVYGQNKKGGVVLRDIRRSVSSFMEAVGIPESHRKLIVGHSLKGMDVHYVHPSDEELHESMAKYHTWLEEQTNLVQNLDRTSKNA